MNLAASTLVSKALENVQEPQRESAKKAEDNYTVYDSKGRVDPEKTLAKITRGEWEDYKRDWEPLEKALLDKSQNDTSLIDSAKADAAKGTGLLEAEMARNTSRYGANLTPAQMQQQKATLARSDVLTDAQIVNDSRIAQKDSNRALAQDLINIGSGVQQQGLAGLTNAAQNASARNQAYQSAKAQHKAQMYSTVGSLASAMIFAAFF